MTEKDKLSSRFKQIVPATEKLQFKFTQKQDNVEKFEINFDDFKQDILNKIDSTPVWFEYSQEQQKELINNFIDKKYPNLSEDKKFSLTNDLLSSVSGFGAVGYLLDKENVDAVIVDGTKSVHISINGKILNADMKLTDMQLSFVLRYISAISRKKIEDVFEFADNDYNITVIKTGDAEPNITIRKNKEYSEIELIENGMFSKDVYDYICSLVKLNKSIVISGSINTGKTTFLKQLIKKAFDNTRLYLISKQNLSVDSIVNFKVDNDSKDYDKVISYIQKSMPEYFISDINCADERFSDFPNKIITIRCSEASDALKQIVSAYKNLLEKYAKQKALVDYDYIINFKRLPEGRIYLDSISKLCPSKSTVISIKKLVKYDNGKYIFEKQLKTLEEKADYGIS